MKILLAYTTVTGGPRTREFLIRFRNSLFDHPPGVEFEIILVCNGGPLPVEEALWIPKNWGCYCRKNVGADIGGYIDVARNFDCEMLVCLGESVYAHRRGWLKMLANTWAEFGPGMYGVFSSNLITPHLNTTAFACDPKLLAGWPEIVKTKEQRYAFEHGERNSFWRRVAGLGRPVKLVTFSGIYGSTEWRAPANIMWKGDQSNCLLWCIHTDRYQNARAEIKRRWEGNADRGLQ